MKLIGIYKITSPTGKVYIGYSDNICRRFRTYRRAKCKGQIKLYRSFEKYNVSNHVFEIIELCNFEELCVRERYWQDYYNSMYEGLNCELTKTNSKPKRMSEETRLKMSISQKGRIHSEETKKKMSDWHLNKIVSEETKDKIRNVKIGLPCTQKVRDKISKSRIDNIQFTHPGRFLTEDQTHTICKALSEGLMSKDIQKLLDTPVSINLINKIRRKETYKNISISYDL